MVLARRRFLLTQELVDSAGPGRHSDGRDSNGLALQVRDRGGRLTRSWIQKLTVNGKQRTKGLGSADVVSLEEARAWARDRVEVVRRLTDEFQIADQMGPRVEVVPPGALPPAAVVQAAPVLELPASVPTVRQVGLELEEEGKAAGKAARTLESWESVHRNYVFPALGDVPVSDVDAAMVLRWVRPFWTKKHAMARQSLTRLGVILRRGETGGHRPAGSNPVEAIRADLPKIASQRHVSMPWEDVPRFYFELETEDGMSARVLQFVILTCVRSIEGRGTLWGEFSEGLWTVPAERMKKRITHRVPLALQVVELIDRVGRETGRVTSDLRLPKRHVFLSNRNAGPVGENSMKRVMERMAKDIRESGGDEARAELYATVKVHGFRSTFRNWAADAGWDAETAELCLAHKLSDSVAQRYNTTEQLKRRRVLMQEWADFVTGYDPDADEANG